MRGLSVSRSSERLLQTQGVGQGETPWSVIMMSDMGAMTCPHGHHDVGYNPDDVSSIWSSDLYLKYRAWADWRLNLTNRIDERFERRMNGNPLSPAEQDGRSAIVASIEWLGQNEKPSSAVPWRGIQHIHSSAGSCQGQERVREQTCVLPCEQQARDDGAAGLLAALLQSRPRDGRGRTRSHLPHRVPTKLKERLLKVAHACTVHQSLTVAPHLSIALHPQSHGGVQPAGGKGVR